MSCKKNLRHLHHLRNPSPHNLAQTFDGPPSLERSGSEHRRAVTSSLFGQERGLVRDVEPSLMGKSDANECNESSLSNCRVQPALSTKKDGMILEKRLDDFRNQNPFSIQKDFQNPSTPHVSYPFPKD